MFRSQGSSQHRADFAQIVRQDGPLLVVLARRLVGQQDAEDVLQAALLAAWRSFTSRADLRNARAWLSQFVAHEAQNLVRRKRRRQGAVEEAGVESAIPMEEVYSTLEATIASDTMSRDPRELLECVDDNLKAAMLTLSEPERTTFLMRVIAELSYKELADLLVVPVGTVMSRLCRTREKLRARLARSKLESHGRAPAPATADALHEHGKRESTA